MQVCLTFWTFLDFYVNYGVVAQSREASISCGNIKLYKKGIKRDYLNLFIPNASSKIRLNKKNHQTQNSKLNAIINIKLQRIGVFFQLCTVLDICVPSLGPGKNRILRFYYSLSCIQFGCLEPEKLQ